jgi:succinate dehydrogenase / fumarate reductase flavoprotein subunit
MNFIGVDPIYEMIPIRPVAHYTMGGIEADIKGKTRMGVVWAGGEVACTSMHGANRLGTNSTAECLVWGGITGGDILDYLKQDPSLVKTPKERIAHEENRIFGELINMSGSENPYTLRKDLREIMDLHLGVYRTGEGMAEGLKKIRSLKERFRDIGIKDKGRIYNSNLINTLEIENMMTLAELIFISAMAREESRGGHARRDFPDRDDENWLKHTLACKNEDVCRLDFKDVTITNWKPVERKY